MDHAKALIVIYDISNNRKRRLLFKQLAAYGAHLQESVFYCPMNAAVPKLLEQLKDLPLTEDERIHCFIVNVEQAASLSPSPINQLEWIAE